MMCAVWMCMHIWVRGRLWPRGGFTIQAPKGASTRGNPPSLGPRRVWAPQRRYASKATTSISVKLLSTGVAAGGSRIGEDASEGMGNEVVT